MFKATPGAFRTSRKVAEEKGTAASGFTPDDYCAPCGIPASNPQHGHYVDVADSVKGVKPKPSAQEKPYKGA